MLSNIPILSTSYFLIPISTDIDYRCSMCNTLKKAKTILIISDRLMPISANNIGHVEERYFRLLSDCASQLTRHAFNSLFYHQGVHANRTGVAGAASLPLIVCAFVSVQFVRCV